MSKVEKKSRSFEMAMKERYAAPAWALFFEVGDGTGAKKNRSADAIAMSLYPSRGLHFYGHEFKASRGDWLTELKNPDKAEKIAAYCDFWHLVDTSGGDAIKEEEVPANWGLLVWNGKTLRQQKKPIQLKPKAPDINFIAGLLRAANYSITSAENKITGEDWLRELDKKSYDRGYETAKTVFDHNKKHLESQVADLKQAIEGFQKISGIELSKWSYGNIGEAVNFLQRLTRHGAFHQILESSGRALKESSDQLLGLVKTLKEAEEKIQASVTK